MQFDLRTLRAAAIFFPLRLTQWIGPLVVAAALALILAIVVVTTGLLDLSASKPHPQGWAELLHYAFLRSTTHHARHVAPPADFGTPGAIAKGAGYYGMVCSRCHGGPGLGQNPVALSMRPRPQYLMHEIGRFSDRDLFWIVKHGVKYSAMPSWPVQDRDDEVWSVVSFLRALPKLTAAQYRALAYGDEAEVATAAPPVPPLAATFATSTYAMPHADEPPAGDYRYGRPTIGFEQFALTGNLAQSCGRCHSAGGIGRAGGTIPNITLLDAGYFRRQLLRFALGARHSGFMLPVATQLSDQQIIALSRYYTAQPKKRSDDVTADPATLAIGQRLAVAGNPARGIGACADCHDITRAAGKAFPAIDGQHAGYLRARMTLYRAQAAGSVPGGNAMYAIAARLDDRAIAAVSAYYAARTPGAGRPAAGASNSVGFAGNK